LESRAGPASQIVKLPASANDVDASIDLTEERPAGHRQSHGSSCDCRVPVAHLLIVLRQPADSPTPVGVAPTKIAFFRGGNPV
jgi:hypothetical protein